MLAGFKDFNKQLWDEAARGDIAALIFVVVLLALYAFAAWGVFYLIDTVGVEPTPESGVVISRDYSPGYFQTITTTVGKTTNTTVVWIPDSWYLEVDFDNYDLKVKCPASEHDYLTVPDSTDVIALLEVGRLSGDHYCEAVLP